jgi:checkpoint serine/threonine-protein kinase
LAVWRFVFQSLSKQLSQSHIKIHHSQAQVTVNPSNGKKERVFVDLRVVYPTPDEPGTELSFEEVWAANRGWLDREWADEVDASRLDCPPIDENSIRGRSVMTEKVPTKLAVHHDTVRLDENGAPIYPKESKPRKKKMIEVNETQISTSASFQAREYN